MNYDQKTILVTGGSSGIGYALIAELAIRGATIHSFDLQPPNDPIPPVSYHQVDIRSRESIRDGLANITNTIDVLINNAGIRRDDTPRGIQEMTDVNVTGTNSVTSLSVPRFSKRPLIVLISSDLALQSQDPPSAYATTKRQSYEQMLEFAHQNKNVRVKYAFPGPVDTPLFREGKTEERIRKINPRTPQYIAEKIIELIESPETRLVCNNDFGVWTHELAD